MSKENQLAQYSIFAAAVLLGESAMSQAVYTDIDPDTIIDADGEHAYIDMNSDGINDFRFFKFIDTGSTYWGSFPIYAYYLFATPLSPSNVIAGVMDVIDPSYGGFTLYYPFALNSGDMINESLDFYNVDFQVLAGKIVSSDLIVVDRGNWQHDVYNKFLGVSFLDTLGCNHYGWIRCDALGTGDTLIIKDYAYETKCDVGIPAGDTIGDTTVNISNSEYFSNTLIYGFAQSVYVVTDLNASNMPLNMSIYNVLGEVIHSEKILERFTSYPLHVPSGVYIVTLQCGTDTYSKSVYIGTY